MTTSRQRNTREDGGGGVTEYKSELWCMVDALRGGMDAAECKHVEVVDALFLGRVSN